MFNRKKYGNSVMKDLIYEIVKEIRLVNIEQKLFESECNALGI